MKKLRVFTLATITLVSTTIASCNKSNLNSSLDKRSEVVNPKTSKTTWYLAVALVVGAVTVIVKAIEGQGATTTTTTTDVHGNTTATSVTTCNGMGSCSKTSMARVGDSGIIPLSSNYDETVMEDYQVQLSVAKTSDGKILLGFDNDGSDNFNRFFYSDRIDYMSEGDTYTIDDPYTLTSLGLEEPIVIRGGSYDVITTADGAKYIQIATF